MEVRNIQLPSTQVGGPVQAEAARPIQTADTSGMPAAARPAWGDAVIISSEAREAILVDHLVQQVLAMPDLRPGAVAAAQAALASGALDSPAAIEGAAEALVHGI